MMDRVMLAVADERRRELAHYGRLESSPRRTRVVRRSRRRQAQ